MNPQQPEDPTIVRPFWVPKRFDWWPGEDENKITYTIREAVLNDWTLVARILRVKPYLAHKWVTQHGYSVLCVSRNTRNIIACIAARHGPEETTVLRFHCSPGFPRNAIVTKFTALLRAEMPEWRVTWTTQPSDDESGLTDHLRALHWKAETTDDESGRTKFVCAPLVPR